MRLSGSELRIDGMKQLRELSLCLAHASLFSIFELEVTALVGRKITRGIDKNRCDLSCIRSGFGIFLDK